MDIANLEKLLERQPPYRLKQVKLALFRDLISDWKEATVLPLVLREKLSKVCPLGVKSKLFVATDQGTMKVVIALKDSWETETVLLRHQDGRNTVCVSSQVGCPLKCTFCLTGRMGFKRNLTVSEIVEQVLFFGRYLKAQREKVTNVVFMGMGEPFLNYGNVLSAIMVLNDPEGFNLGARHISISTVGIVEGIRRLAQEKLQVNLAVSLNAPNNPLRSKLMPINKKYPIKKVLETVDYYLKKTNRRVMFEYIMIKDINDTESCAYQLAKLVKGKLCLVNLISYNPTEKFKPASWGKIKRFREILEREGVAVTQRYRFGRDIKAACGQLATSFWDLPGPAL